MSNYVGFWGASVLRRYKYGVGENWEVQHGFEFELEV